ncbi:NB-ARC domain-containing protein [Coleofasciculus sp. FACHB-1120]|uniref:NB-ARC domain-containing protein n=1 Tax=Coleofasciculus sp. FACHB-1120 TaxID=2692783 RepID=UPI001682ECA6|nr:NB-ARC domain-containing protein [Coleofasciculus sp. FACHB-1120]MBD2744413.1 ATP-binding protein [Coleofasciculus sp. FACHB-1120]
MTVSWWQAALTTQATLKRFWQKKPIQQETFIHICQAVGIGNWKEIVDSGAVEEAEAPEMPILDWGEAPDVSGFYGRTEELAVLEKWIVADSCHLVTLSGMGGIGKTALSVMLAEQIQNEFDYFIWRSLRSAPSVEDLLADLLRLLCNEQSIDFPKDIGRRIPQLISQLIESLRFPKGTNPSTGSHRCLLILDEVETILGAGQATGYYREGYEGYSELFRRVGRERHNSCLILIGREQPNEVGLMQGETPIVRSLLLSDLKDTDAWQIFRAKGLSDENHWRSLFQIYRGNPLILNIIASYIKDSFAGKVSDFLKLETIFLGDIHLILDTSWQRLSNFQKEIMFNLAAHLNPSSIFKLKEEINQTVSTSEIMEAIQALERRSLIEKQIESNEVIYTLQPVVRRYVKRKIN